MRREGSCKRTARHARAMAPCRQAEARAISPVMPLSARRASTSVFALVAAILAFGGAGCEDGGEETLPAGAAGAGGDAGSAGSAGGDPGVDGACPDPTRPGVRYFSSAAAQCRAEQLGGCSAEETGFFNTCGCGCYPRVLAGECPPNLDSEADFRSRDPGACAVTTFECPLGAISFSNACGCGCLPPLGARRPAQRPSRTRSRGGRAGGFPGYAARGPRSGPLCRFRDPGSPRWA